ncbi:benzoate/H(+) symporter BenE family transporter [Pseudomonas guariconensis]|uniref:benzoate/H(+) symporter BenE family transporter n=1 Tax=Pseudomonas guariconensis TaxID=1288410 RepID=UPI002D1F27DB|nr:benzoate/H(+) symporter BenE family transporter [Pseudomonas guariconensis]MEB3841257.1 benzoate/H(+) symporter BenE family transporter [Pseudomonas guariconensis]MEB3874125.1 benzoate/H(+) symporter BenE family transporter [Pseudomonas guariconensis]MEB3877445.1 benzoate/H(+) symporter BenE family transporter [Pseudomonas guariconensis]MEB3893895.1 benzoate/H(+) symporter BenE family transporter [Pseudomonas guariconensis]
MKDLFKDCSVSAIVAGMIATMISYAGPLVIIFHAAEAAGLPHAVLSSWVWAVSMGSALLGALLSLRYRVPVVIAWSIPGSALLVTALPQLGLEQAIGAYLVANLVLLVIGISGAFDRIIARLPGSIAAGMQAGILFSFGAEVFRALPAQPMLVLAMFATYVLMRARQPRYAVAMVLLVGALVTLLSGQFRSDALVLELASPRLIAPQFSVAALFSLALPMVLVALTGQFMPGMAVLRNAGYSVPASPLISASAVGGALLAPFGCHGLNLAAVTASLCTGREAHEDPRRRYVAAVSGSVLYLLLGIAGATLMSLFAAFPAALIAALAGLALYGAISEALVRSLSEPGERDAGLFTFLVTASGVSFLGLSAPFWGLLFGLAAHVLPRLRRPLAQAALRRAR